ncbi:MAG: hypothetical protein DHS20C18_06760 [Saprospiraceae bacterium]|nr:MAG: hypothetical protein DHS20C18_06760 [Saprospiraceae bacterium]
MLFSQRRRKSSFEQLYNAGTLNQELRLQNATAINTAGLEFSPVIYENGLVYVSRYKSGPIDEKTGETFFELFYAELDPNGMPLRPVSFSTELNSQQHEGPVSFNHRGDRIFFTRSNQRKGITKADSEGKVGLKIYEAQRGFFDWENVVELPFNNDEYSCLHPSLSMDEKKLFFASNMPGGFGGMDLYFVEKRGEIWSQPINLGPEVNTIKNEVFPFIHESGALFFASDGHPGFGGLDLFMIDLGGRRWGRVINLGEPFNSEKDDLGFILNPTGTIGYFTSSRDGGYGGDDIYVFSAPNGIKGIEAPAVVNTKVSVYDGTSSKRISDASIRIFESSPEGLLNNEELYNLEMLPRTNESDEMVLKLVRKKEDELGQPKLTTDRSGEAYAEMDENTDYLILISKPGYTTKEITYSTGSKDATLPLEIMLEPSNCMTLEGKVFSNRYNLKIPNALIRIVNDCDGTEELAHTNIKGVFEVCLAMGCDFTITAEKDGYSTEQTEISTVKMRGSRSMNIELSLTAKSNVVLKEPIRKGTVIILENIYYDFNKSAIRKGAAPDLDALAKLMKQYPTLEVELGAHTDCRGTDAYNLELSLRRAESAKDFLVQKGIAANRMSVFGYGEAFPRNRCRDGVDCSEEEHQYNRRTEVKVLKIDEPIDIGFNTDGLEVRDQ